MAIANAQLIKDGNRYILVTGLITQRVEIKLLSAELIALTQKTSAGVEVEVERDGIKVISIKAAPHLPKGNRTRAAEQPLILSQEPSTSTQDYFHNPYNFIPAPPRKDVNGILGDCRPVGHDAYLDGYWTGRIRVKATLATPLLLPDAAKLKTETILVDGKEKDHKTYPVRQMPDGTPYIPPTSIKGMLRAAYEAVTNSRMGVLEKHEEYLAFRMSTARGLGMVPARVESVEANGLAIRLLPGFSEIQADGTPRLRLMYAAWLPARDAGRFKHRQKMWAIVRQQQHGPFNYWKVIEAKNQETDLRGLNADEQKIEGYVCITNRNIGNKHDERIFFDDPDCRPLVVPLAGPFRERWQKLIASYRQNEDMKKGLTRPSTEGEGVVWSRHMKGDEDADLSVGALIYAEVRRTGDGYDILGLYPVNISRDLSRAAPIDLLPQELRSATNINQLSPSDRVFGWVNQDGQGAYRGQLRVGQTVGLSAKDIDWFDNQPLPLSILAQPKPQQGRFYVAENRNGDAQPDGRKKEDTVYANGKGLRGRKVYPHQGSLSEYRRVHDKCDDQNRSIKGWVKENTEFSFDIHVTNLHPVELGTLLWLLMLPAEHFFRLGGGKPFGFGSVRLGVEWTTTDLRLGENWRAYYNDLSAEESGATQSIIEACKQEFEKEIVIQYKRLIPVNVNKTAENVPFLAAFLAAARGFSDDKPIHYPRRTLQREVKGEEAKVFEWFAANEKVERGIVVRGHALPHLTAEDNRGLTYK